MLEEDISQDTSKGHTEDGLGYHSSTTPDTRSISVIYRENGTAGECSMGALQFQTKLNACDLKDKEAPPGK
jgi:hypothetical protein